MSCKIEQAVKNLGIYVKKGKRPWIKRNNIGENNPKWKGGISEQWYRKLMTKNNIPPICVGCGQTKNLVIHHIDGNHQNNVIENLEYRCAKCHSKIHLKGRKMPEKIKTKISQTLKQKIKNGEYKPRTKEMIEAGKKTRFKKGQRAWWQKNGYTSTKEAIISKRGYFNKEK